MHSRPGDLIRFTGGMMNLYTSQSSNDYISVLKNDLLLIVVYSNVTPSSFTVLTQDGGISTVDTYYLRTHSEVISTNAAGKT